MADFLLRLLFKAFFPLKAHETLTHQEHEYLRSKYGLTFLLKAIGISVLIFIVTETLMNMIAGWFYPTEKNNCYYCYNNSTLVEFSISAVMTFFLVRQYLRRRLMDDYDKVKIYWSIRQQFNVSKSVKAMLIVAVLFFILISYTETSKKIGFCEDGFESKNFTTKNSGTLVKGLQHYKYSDIANVQYCYAVKTNKDKTTYTNFEGIRLELASGDQILLQQNSFGDGSSNVRDKVLTRIMNKTGRTQMDTVENDL